MGQSIKNKVVIITTKIGDELDQYQFTNIGKIKYWEFINDTPSFYQWAVINSIVLKDAKRVSGEGCKYFDINHSGEISNETELIDNIDKLINDLSERGYNIDDENYPLFIDNLSFKHSKTSNGDWICLFPCLPDGDSHVGREQYFIEFLLYAWCNSVLKDKELAKDLNKILEKYDFIFLMHDKDFTTDAEKYKEILLNEDDFNELDIKRSDEVMASINNGSIKVVLFQHDGSHAKVIYGKLLTNLMEESAHPNDDKLDEWIQSLDYFIDNTLFINWKEFIKFRNEIEILRAINKEEELKIAINKFMRDYSSDIKSIFNNYKEPSNARNFLFSDERTINPDIVNSKLEDIKTNFDTILKDFKVHYIF